jgi:UDP:flavonoid glycosyltransferase YjiC (YdhE family)
MSFRQRQAAAEGRVDGFPELISSAGPMRVLFTATASSRTPFAPLGWAFRTAGHDVLVAATGPAAEAVDGTGLPTTVIAGDPTRPVHTTHDTLDGLRDQQLRRSEAVVDELVQLTRRYRPGLIVHEANAFSAVVAGAVAGVPTVSYLDGGPAVLRLESQDGAMLPRYVRLFTRFGVEPRPGPAAWLDPCPPSMALPAEITRLPIRFMPAARSGVLPAWLFDAPRRPRVCVAWRITESAGGADRFRQVIDAVATLDAEVVLAVTGMSALPPESADVRTVEPGVAAMPELLRSCDALVHQGWTDTMLTAAACATPQLVVATGRAQVLAGDRLVAVGAGRSVLTKELPLGESGADVIGGEVAKLMDRPAHLSAARRLRAEIEQQPAPAELVATLTDLPVMRAHHRSA